MKYLKGFGQFWYDFLIGDDWKIAAAVLGSLSLTLVVVATGIISDGAATVFGAVLIASTFSISMIMEARRAK